MLIGAQDIVALTCGCPSIFSFQRSTKLENFYVLNQTLSFARTTDSKRKRSDVMVGLGRFELPTSPLSGVRSNQLSYRPSCALAGYGGQALSVTLHSSWLASRSAQRGGWWSWSGSNRRPPECKSGALPAELQPLCSCWIRFSPDPFKFPPPLQLKHLRAEALVKAGL